MNTPHVTIIVLTWNHWDVTEPCLHSVSRLDYPRHDVLVVDNGSTDGTPAQVRRHFPSMTVVENDRNLGFAAGCNVGIRHALDQETDFILLLNNDALVPPRLLEELTTQAEMLPSAAILSPALYHLDDPERLWFTGSRRHPLTLESADFGPMGSRRHRLQHEREVVDYIFGTAMLIRATALRRVGLFDEAFFMYYEDMDLCLRMQAAGYTLYHLPGVRVGHQVSASTSAYSATRYYHKARSSVIFFHKHTGIGRRFVVIPYRLGSALRTLARLARQRQYGAARAYVSGLRDGLHTVRHATPLSLAGGI